MAADDKAEGSVAPVRPLPPKLKARDEVSITLSILTTSDTETIPKNSYRVEYKEHPHAWTDSTQIQTVVTSVGATEVILNDLMPTSTYEIRIVAINAEGQESPYSEIVAVDTDVPGTIIIILNSK